MKRANAAAVLQVEQYHKERANLSEEHVVEPVEAAQVLRMPQVDQARKVAAPSEARLCVVIFNEGRAKRTSDPNESGGLA